MVAVYEDAKVSVFAKNKRDLFTVYRCELSFRERIVGGTPKNPKLIEGWLRKSAGISDEEELRHALLRTLEEMGADVTDDMGYDQLVAASEALASEKHETGFKRDEHGLYIEDRQIKAMLKENTNIKFGKDRWGPTRKGAKGYLSERVFVHPSRIYLGMDEPTGVDMFIGHVNGPQGKQSNVGYYEYVEDAVIEFEVMVMDDVIEEGWWGSIWTSAEENGLGAKRSQSFGRFYVTEWEKVS